MSTCEVVAFVQTLQSFYLECVQQTQTSVFRLDICISMRLSLAGEHFVTFPSAASLASLHAAAVQWMLCDGCSGERAIIFLSFTRCVDARATRRHTEIQTRSMLCTLCSTGRKLQAGFSTIRKSSTRAEQTLDFIVEWLKIKACSQSR